MPDEPHSSNVVKFAPGIWGSVCGYVLGFLLGLLVMLCLILLGIV